MSMLYMSSGRKNVNATEWKLRSRERIDFASDFMESANLVQLLLIYHWNKMGSFIREDESGSCG